MPASSHPDIRHASADAADFRTGLELDRGTDLPILTLDPGEAVEAVGSWPMGGNVDVAKDTAGQIPPPVLGAEGVQAQLDLTRSITTPPEAQVASAEENREVLTRCTGFERPCGLDDETGDVTGLRLVLGPARPDAGKTGQHRPHRQVDGFGAMPRRQPKLRMRLLPDRLSEVLEGLPAWQVSQVLSGVPGPLDAERVVKVLALGHMPSETKQEFLRAVEQQPEEPEDTAQAKFAFRLEEENQDIPRPSCCAQHSQEQDEDRYRDEEDPEAHQPVSKVLEPFVPSGRRELLHRLTGVLDIPVDRKEIGHEDVATPGTIESHFVLALEHCMALLDLLFRRRTDRLLPVLDFPDKLPEGFSLGDQRLLLRSRMVVQRRRRREERSRCRAPRKEEQENNYRRQPESKLPVGRNQPFSHDVLLCVVIGSVVNCTWII